MSKKKEPYPERPLPRKAFCSLPVWRRSWEPKSRRQSRWIFARCWYCLANLTSTCLKYPEVGLWDIIVYNPYGYNILRIWVKYPYIYIYNIVIWVKYPEISLSITHMRTMVLVYIPTFGWFLGQMLVNIPYMEHLGNRYSSICSYNRSSVHPTQKP